MRAVRAVAVPVGANGSPPPSDYRIDVTSINRGFMLAPDYLPGTSFVQWSGSQTLTPAQPTAMLWQAPDSVVAPAPHQLAIGPG